MGDGGEEDCAEVGDKYVEEEVREERGREGGKREKRILKWEAGGELKGGG